MNTYGGYTNYETWLYNLYLTNEADVFTHYEHQLMTMDAYEFSLFLKSEMEEQISERDLPAVLCDLLMSACSEINFYEIAATHLNAYKSQLLDTLMEDILHEYDNVTCNIRNGKLVVTTSDSTEDWQIGNRLKEYGDVYRYEELSEDRESDFYQIELTLNN